jgi:YVTN family beta-propeller protein
MMAPTARWADWFARYWPITDGPAEYGAALAPLDPVTALSEAGGRAVLLQFGSQDRFLPLAVADEIESAAGSGADRRDYDAAHELNDEARGERDAWLAESLGFEPQVASGTVIDVCVSPIGIASAAGSIWVACYFDGTLVRIDAVTREVLEPVEVGLGAIGVTVAAGSLWVTLHELSQVVRVDPQSGDVQATIDVGPQPEGIAGDDDGVWVTIEETGQVQRMDPATNEIVATIDGGFGPEGIAFTDDAVWVANVRDGTVSRIDPATNTVVGTIPTGTASEGLVVDDRGNVWVAVTGAGEVATIAGAAPDEVLQAIPVGDQPRRMVYVDGQLWVTNTGDGTVSVPVAPVPE